MQRLVLLIGSFLQFTIGTTVCESMAAAANIFLGMTEAPLVIRPFLSKMTLSELHTVMTSGFSTIAGSVMAAYISFGTRRGLKPHGKADTTAPAKPERKKIDEASPGKGFEGRPGESSHENNGLVQVRNSVETQPCEVPAEGSSRRLAYLEAQSPSPAPRGVGRGGYAQTDQPHLFGVSLEKESGNLLLTSSSCAERGGCVRVCRRQQRGVILAQYGGSAQRPVANTAWSPYGVGD
ncbi:hypothetical protein MTO96_032785 [Rhipicephalus appendiculatus]